ncbi:MAG: glycosyltransferase family 2 protein [Halobacteriaceae archaeon]
MVEHVHAVVLNWNNYDDTKRCIQSLQNTSYENLHIWLVDNGSTDESPRRLRNTFGDDVNISIIEIEENKGYGGGMNVGIKAALDKDADAVFALNNDIVFPKEDVITLLTNKLQQYPSLGAISPMVKYLDTGEIKSKGADTGPMIPEAHFERRQKQFQAEIKDPDLNYGVSYSACLFTAEALRDGSLFPEEYFMYVEDIEHGLLLEDSGFHRATHTGVTISHEFHGSTDPHGALPTYYKARNWLLLHQKRILNPRGRFLFWYLYFIVTRLIHRLVTLNVSSAIGLIRGVIDGFRGRQGRGPYP